MQQAFFVPTLFITGWLEVCFLQSETPTTSKRQEPLQQMFSKLLQDFAVSIHFQIYLHFLWFITGILQEINPASEDISLCGVPLHETTRDTQTLGFFYFSRFAASVNKEVTRYRAPQRQDSSPCPKIEGFFGWLVEESSTVTTQVASLITPKANWG